MPNLCTWGPETGGEQVPDQSGLHNSSPVSKQGIGAKRKTDFLPHLRLGNGRMAGAVGSGHSAGCPEMRITSSDLSMRLCHSSSSIMNVPGESTLRREFLRLQQENKSNSEALKQQQQLQQQQQRDPEAHIKHLLHQRQRRIEEQKEERRRVEEQQRREREQRKLQEKEQQRRLEDMQALRREEERRQAEREQVLAPVHTHTPTSTPALPCSRCPPSCSRCPVPFAPLPLDSSYLF